MGFQHPFVCREKRLSDTILLITMRLLAKVLLLHASVALSSHIFEERALSPSACSKVELIVAVLKINGATPFCSSYLGIPAGTTTVVKPLGTTTLTTGTTTVTAYSNPIVTVTAYVCLCSAL
jgi:hypothetical protein